MANLATYDWSILPAPIVVHILSYLSVNERCRAGSTCTHWHRCLETPVLWKSLRTGFFLPAHANLLRCVAQYSRFVHRLTIVLIPQEKVNRESALAVLDNFSGLEDVRLSHLTIQFKGTNPLFYSGQEFIISLSKLFMKVGENLETSNIKYLNFRELQVNFDGDFIRQIAASCPNLEYLNIINEMLICNVPPDSMVYLAQQCKKIRELHTFHTSLSDEVLKALSQPGRQPLKKLGLLCRREEKYGNDLSSDAWSLLTKGNSKLRIDLGFDHTCPLIRIGEIMKSQIPVEELHFVTFTAIHLEVQMASMYYDKTLVKLIIHTKPVKELEVALVNLARRCVKLRVLYVYGVLRKEIIDQILALLPDMKDKGSYILKWKMEPEPFTVGQEGDEFP